MLDEIKAQAGRAVRRHARNLDGPASDIALGEVAFAEAERALTPGIKDDIRFAHDRVQDFARRQRDSMHEFSAESLSGLMPGQSLIPCGTAGCYLPRGRYAHAASAIMSLGTAQGAGVKHIVATPAATRAAVVHPGLLYAMKLCGAHTVLAFGGVQAVAALACDLFSAHESDIIVGQGNRFVATAKRLLFGLPGLARKAAAAAWRDCAEVVLCDTRGEVVQVSEHYASEHLQVMANDLDWWLQRLSSYGSLFLGEGTTVACGDKFSGPNHSVRRSSSTCRAPRGSWWAGAAPGRCGASSTLPPLAASMSSGSVPTSPWASRATGRAGATPTCARTFPRPRRYSPACATRALRRHLAGTIAAPSSR